MTPRAWAYSAILLVLTGVIIVLLATRSPIETIFLRMEGQLYQKDNTKIVNIYNYTLINKTDHTKTLEFVPKEEGVELILLGEKTIVLAPEEIKHGNAMIKIERAALAASSVDIVLEVVDEHGEHLDQISTSFLGPLVRK